MSNVTLNNVCKVYRGEHSKEVTAVRDFNLEVNDREFIVFVGPSGCGKSTTLRMVAGLEEISRGEIRIDGRRVNEVPPKDRDIAMVFQNYALYPHMSVYDNLAFALKLRRFPKARIKERVESAAAILGIEDYLGRKPKALSGGQRQRVALGRAIVRRPKVFLFDEPLSNLDAKMRVQMRVEIVKLHRRLDATMIYVTHDQVEAMTMGDRIVVMKDGLVQQVDTPLKVYHEPVNLFVAGFLGSPPMNVLHGSLRQSGGKLVFAENHGGTIELECPDSPALATFAGREVIVGIRPEDIAMAHPGTPAASRFSAVIEMVEPMGAETHLHVGTGGHNLVCRGRDGVGHGGIGRRGQFGVAMERVHFFDPQTRERIVPRS